MAMSAAPAGADSPFCDGTGGSCHRLLWVLSRRRVVLFYWLIMCLFPPSLRGGERRGLGQSPKAACKFGSCCLVERFLFRLQAFMVFPTAQSAIRGRCQLFVGCNSFSQFDHSCQEEERAAQSNYRSVFSPQPVARACAVPKFSCC